MKTTLEKSKGFRRLIPSMTAVLEFEAVARLGSFTIAARELGVTQAAVSRQIKTLEDGLGVKLFDRLHRSIRLTEEGEALYETVSVSLRRIAGTIDSISRINVEQEYVLAATAPFSNLRISPKLRQLNGLMPELRLRLVTSMFNSDLIHKDIDLSIRFGDGNWNDGVSYFLFDEEVFPVCSPDFLTAHGMPKDAASLAKFDLIDCEASSEGWIVWDDWLRAMGVEYQSLTYSFRCALYTDAIEAACQGQGILLGWSRLLEDHLKSGQLIRLTSQSLKVDDSYFAIVKNQGDLDPTTKQLIDWLKRD